MAVHSSGEVKTGAQSSEPRGCRGEGPSKHCLPARHPDSQAQRQSQTRHPGGHPGGGAAEEPDAERGRVLSGPGLEDPQAGGGRTDTQFWGRVSRRLPAARLARLWAQLRGRGTSRTGRAPAFRELRVTLVGAAFCGGLCQAGRLRSGRHCGRAGLPQVCEGPGVVPQLPGCGPLGRALQCGGHPRGPPHISADPIGAQEASLGPCISPHSGLVLATPSVLAPSLPCHTQGARASGSSEFGTLTCHFLVPGANGWPGGGPGTLSLTGDVGVRPRARRGVRAPGGYFRLRPAGWAG